MTQSPRTFSLGLCIWGEDWYGVTSYLVLIIFLGGTLNLIDFDSVTGVDTVILTISLN